MEKLEIKKLKIAIIYGKQLVDGNFKDGIITRIFRDAKNDTAHFFYLKEFLKNNFKDNPALQNANSANTILYELAHSGNIAFAENTSHDSNRTGIFFMPDSLTDRQKDSLSIFENQLNKENYSITILSDLHRNEEEAIVGKQKIGSSSLLNYFIKQPSIELEQ